MIHHDGRKTHHVFKCVYAGSNSVVCAIPIIANADGTCPFCQNNDCRCPRSVMVQETSGAIPNDETNASHCGTLLHDLFNCKPNIKWANEDGDIDFSSEVEGKEEGVASKSFLSRIVSSMIDTIVAKYEKLSWLGIAGDFFVKALKKAASLIAKNPATFSALGAFAFVLYHYNDLHNHALAYYQQNSVGGIKEAASVFPLEGLVGILGAQPLVSMFSSLLLMKSWGECLKYKAEGAEDDNPLISILSGTIKGAGTFVALVSLQLGLINAKAYNDSKDPKKFYTSIGTGKTWALHVNREAKQDLVKESHAIASTEEAQIANSYLEKLKAEKQVVKPPVVVVKKSHSATDKQQQPGVVTYKRLKTLKKLVKRYGERTKEGILQELARVEQELKQKHSRGSKKGQKTKSHTRVRPVPEKPQQQKRGKKSEYTLSDLETMYKKYGDAMHQPLYIKLVALRRNAKPSDGNRPQQCQYCGKMGHTATTCPKLLEEEKVRLEQAQFPTLPKKKVHGKKGGKPYPKDTQFSYLIDKYDDNEYKVPNDQVDDFRRWVQMGFQQRINSGMKWEFSDRDPTDFSLEGQLFDRENYSRKNIKEQHARTSVKVLKNTVQVLDANGEVIACGTLFAPRIVGMLKHYFKDAVPTFASKGGSKVRITQTMHEVSTATDYFVFGLLESSMDYTKNTLKVPTKTCRGLLLGMGDLEPIKIDLGVDRVTNDKELLYHAVSQHKDCGRAVCDSEDNTIVGLNAGVYLNTGVAFGVPVTENTLVAFERFLF
jgi:hypothetical protein